MMVVMLFDDNGSPVASYAAAATDWEARISAQTPVLLPRPENEPPGLHDGTPGCKKAAGASAGCCRSR